MFNNRASGIIQKNGSGETATGDGVGNNIVFSNFGDVHINSGSFAIHTPLAADSSSIHTGGYYIEAGAELSGTASLSLPALHIYNNGLISLASLTLTAIDYQVIHGNGSINNLTINNTLDAFLQDGNQTINNSLTFVQGKISTGTNKLIIGDAATVTGASESTGYVIGNLQRNHNTVSSALTYDIGDAAYYTPVIINANITTNGGITVRTDGGDHPYVASSGIDESKSVNRHWAITNDGASIYNCCSHF